ncbi:WD repeat-containing protein 17-like isoform X2 [Lineus longissimus]|uniref:WD repeat-containing protein 17-like isoform X2 n=1 Tax=Lineus longissimus TaxID=88925 RepID=UPI002B4E87A6
MTSVKQVGLLAAGSQPWNRDVCAASGDRFAYSATLAVYIYQLDRQFNEFRMHSIMSEHKKTITAISWDPRNHDIIATSSAECTIIIWNISEQKVITKLDNMKSAPCSIGWCYHERESVGFVSGRGPLYIWNHIPGGAVTVFHKDTHNFLSDVCQFRWHQRRLGKVAFGHMDGTLSVFMQGQKCRRHVFRPESLEDSDEDDPVLDIEWDPLSTDYILTANTYTGVRMIDTDSMTVIMTFQTPSVAALINTIAWISTAPGMFLTGDRQSGIMRLWNVSRETPIENISIKSTGFHAMHVFSTVYTPHHGSAEQNDHHVSSTSPAVPASAGPARFALPPGNAVCTFMDGGVGLYNLAKRNWTFLRDEGHVETIFDCKFKPDDPSLLATASFDGTMKVWHTDTLTAVHASPGNEGVIYSLSWAPADLHCIAAATSRNGCFIWDIEKGKIIQRFKEHGTFSVFSIAWCQKDSRRIASCGADGHCVIRQVDGQLIQRYKHPGAAFGCDWSPHNKDMIATGCDDKAVRIFYLATNSEQPIKTFLGHTAKVFHVRWSPLREGILCSGSDDCTIRIWDYSQGACVNILSDHTRPVRGLLWNPEIPYLLISGSWDNSIRIWDARDGACVETILDHGADVYGLTCHPMRPFVLASCSRDSTVRIWSLTPLVMPLEMNILAQRPWTEITGTVEHASVLGTPPLLAGRVSRDLKHRIDKLKGDVFSRTIRWFSTFFMHPGGATNLWELIAVINGMSDSMLSPQYKQGIMHMKHTVMFKESEAQQLEMIRMRQFTGVGAMTKEESLTRAAAIHIRLGNLRRYCELMVEMGKWETALSIAPGVSMDYWKSLTERRAQSLMHEDSDDALGYCMAAGMTDELVTFLTSRGQLKDATLIAHAVHNGYSAAERGQKQVMNDATDGNDTRLLEQTYSDLADWYFRNGSPIMAACCHLAVENFQEAMSKLIRGNELELAVSAGMVLNKAMPLTYVALELLSRKCEKIGRWDLAVDLINIIPDNRDALIKLCSKCAASMAEIDDLHSKAGLPGMEESSQQAELLQTDGDVHEAIRLYLLSTCPEKALKIGLKFVKDKMKESDWQANDVFDVLQLLGAIKTEKLHQHQCTEMKNELLTLCSYVGGLVALRRQYDTIVTALFRNARHLLEKEGPKVPLSMAQIDQEIDAWEAHHPVSNKKKSRKKSPPTEDLVQVYQSLQSSAGEEMWPVQTGMDCIASSHLPSHSDCHVSLLNQQRIQGPTFFLEDGRSAISINDALMWAKVNPFSPLNSGVRINPF